MASVEDKTPLLRSLRNHNDLATLENISLYFYTNIHRTTTHIYDDQCYFFLNSYIQGRLILQFINFEVKLYLVVSMIGHNPPRVSAGLRALNLKAID